MHVPVIDSAGRRINALHQIESRVVHRPKTGAFIPVRWSCSISSAVWALASVSKAKWGLPWNRKGLSTSLKAWATVDNLAGGHHGHSPLSQ